MKLLSLAILFGAGLAATNEMIPLSRDASLCDPSLCQPPACVMTRPGAILRSLAAGYYFSQGLRRKVLLVNPCNRQPSTGAKRWVYGSRHGCRPGHDANCRFISYEAAKSIYKEYKSLNASEINDLLVSRGEDSDDEGNGTRNARDELWNGLSGGCLDPGEECGFDFGQCCSGMCSMDKTEAILACQ